MLTMNKMKFYKKLLFLIILIFSAGTLSAQGFSAKHLAFGQSNRAAVKDVEAIWYNPANLAKNKWISFSFLSMGGAVSNSAFSIADYNDYFSVERPDTVLSSSQKRDLLDKISDSGLNIHSQIQFNIFAIAVHNFGFSADYVAFGGSNINSKKFLEIALFGEDLTRNYTFFQRNLAKGEGLASLRLSAVYAYPFKETRRWGIGEIAVGGKLSYYLANIYGKVVDSDFSLKRFNTEGSGFDNEAFTYDLSVTALSSQPQNGSAFPGKGAGLDLSVTSLYEKDWQFSISMENVFGSISWSGKNERIIFNSRDTAIANDDIDRSFEEDTTVTVGSFSTRLPQTLYFSAAYSFSDEWQFYGQWRQGLDTRFNNTPTPGISLGANYAVLDWLDLRSGFTFFGRENFLWGMGAGFHSEVFEFDLSWAMRQALWPSFSNGFFFGHSFKIHL